MHIENFRDKVVVITGGATGIGFAFAKQFGREGAKIVIAEPRQNRIDQAVDQLTSMGIRAAGTTCDVTDLEQVEALADFSWSTFGKVDVIINNAGIGEGLKPLLETTREDFDRLFNVNVFGVLNGITVFGKRLIEQGTPCCILNLGSENSLFNGVPLSAPYVASKHVVHTMTEHLREQVPEFVHVGLVCPGLVNSELGEGITFGMDTDKFTGVAMEQIKAGRFYIVSHAFNMERIEARHNEIADSFAQYAPRYEGDSEFDVRTLFAQMQAAE